MIITTEQVQNALRELIDPVMNENLVDSKSVKNIVIADNSISLEIVLGYPEKSVTEPIRKQVVDRLKKIDGIGNVSGQCVFENCFS